MKKLMPIICIAVLVASCREQQHLKQQTPAGFQAIEDHSSRQSYTISDFLHQFDFNLSAIYGDMSGNKAWH